MGARQSKRSVDITTEPSKEILEGTGELKKLDDTFVKENDSLDKENKVANDAAENEKNESAKASETPAVAPEVEENIVEAPNADDKPTDEIKEATPEPDGAAKPKKEKVKKKWSFRSISFGKKDKQKPSKKDKKNEDNKAVVEGTEAKEDDETKPAETVEEKPQEEEAAAAASETNVETKPLEPVVETVVKEEPIKEEEKIEEVKAAPAPEPVPAVVEPVKAKTPEPVIETPQAEEIIAEAPAVEKVVETSPAVEISPPAPIEEITEPAQPPPAIPTTPPPSQFSVFAESMNTATIVEESLPEPLAAEIEKKTEDFEKTQEVAEKMVEKVLEQAVDHVESETAEKDDEDLPPPPADEIFDTPQVVVEVKENGVGDHTVETIKLENGVHNGDDVNESKPIVEELKKEDKVSDKIAQDSQLAPEIISE